MAGIYLLLQFVGYYSGRTNYSKTSSWMKMRFNQTSYWCNCHFPICMNGHYKKGRTFTLEAADILVVNNQYCLVTAVGYLKNKQGDLTIDVFKSEEDVEKLLGKLGGFYFYHRIILLIFLFFYINRIYLFDYRRWKSGQ